MGRKGTRNGQEVQLLSDPEMEHFKDVKALVRFDYRVQIFSLIFALAFMLGVALPGKRAGWNPWFYRSWRELASGIKWGAALALAGIILLGLGELVFGFDRLFLGFHLTFFNNDLWIARPGAIMTTLFQEYFFREAALFIAGGIVVEALVLCAVGWRFRRKPEGRRETLAPMF